MSDYNACIELKKESWENIIATIKQSDMKPVGNFWAAIQRIQEQLEAYEL